MNLDKYEGHTEGPWKWDNEGVLQGKESVLWVDFLEPNPDWQLNNSAIHVSEADEELIADAPLLLEEIKRLQDYNAALLNWMMNHLDRDEDEVKEMIYE